jgi:hypothetical protein
LVNPLNGATLSYGANNSVTFTFAAAVSPVTMSAGYSGPGSIDVYNQLVYATIGHNMSVTLSNLATADSHPTLYVRLSAGGLVKDYTFATPPVYYRPTQTGVNLWNIPIDLYTANNVDPTPGNSGPIVASCSAQQSVRSCFQQFLSYWHNQGVTGVRFSIVMSIPIGMPPGRALPTVVTPPLTTTAQAPPSRMGISATHGFGTRRARLLK